ncbi:AbrB/MazE/SpoVT family DNA-binding domain-containing protein [Candidatus Woesearchaeota archaeon]|nr:AbrB/MazE/SpoVT family DNA-binding domain-containing protein [Candidatus Woesearchaeota archaeon]
MEQQSLIIETIKVGKKGQITLPIKIREMDNIREHDRLKLSHMPNGNMVLTKINIGKTPEDEMLEIIDRAPRFDWRKVWKEMEEERAREG